MTRHLSSEEFDSNARAALADTQLRGALRRATGMFTERRRAAIAAVPDWEQMREQARAIKEETLCHLDRYLEEFALNAEKAGAKVHWARDAAECCATVVRIARERGARLLVKSKSMATEEIGLNARLEAEGMQPVETDLGEYIIQLAGETPSHIIAPAIHKTRGQVSELFEEKLGSAPTDDIAEMTQTARRVLRDYFARADIGVSGVNFGVAETGTILILENEGNIRLTTSLPRAHIAVMGIEKLIPRFSDLELFLRLLPRSGTGQHLSTYQSLITGVKRGPADEGPDEVHIILLDNGRSRMLARQVTRQALACIRCGACLNVCPVYQQVGGHAYGSVYPGPIGSVITPQLVGLGKAAQLPFASSLCGACRDACPVKINIPELLLHLRAEINSGSGPRQAGSSFKERLGFWLFARVMSSRSLYELSGRVARLAQRALTRKGRVTESDLAAELSPMLGRWTAWRDMRPVAERTFREQWRDGLKSKGQGDGAIE
jgi:L-lactate dehydrogenase complex protein LldF